MPRRDVEALSGARSGTVKEGAGRRGDVNGAVGDDDGGEGRPWWSGDPRRMQQHERESHGERLARNWSELLQEIRVAQAGVQILFAFLLTLPFTQRWGEVTTFQRGIYLTTLLLAALASALLIGPVAYHRMVFRRGAKPILVEAANSMALAGLFVLALAINGVVLLVVDVLMGTLATVLIASGTGLTFLWLWVLMPLVVRSRLEKRDDSDDLVDAEDKDEATDNLPGAGG